MRIVLTDKTEPAAAMDERAEFPDELPDDLELPELPDLPEAPELPGGGTWPEPEPGELLHQIETQMRRVQAFAEDAAGLFALGRALSRERVQLVASPRLDCVPGEVLVALSSIGGQLEAAIEATFEFAGRGAQRSAVRQHAELFCQREVAPLDSGLRSSS